MLAQVKFIAIAAFTMLLADQKNRAVVIFTNRADNPNVAQQLNVLKADPKGIKDRDITFKVVTCSPADMELYKSWHIPANTFTVVLIGKDGGEKLRSHTPVSLAKLYDLIDSMPMRQQEIKNKH